MIIKLLLVISIVSAIATYYGMIDLTVTQILLPALIGALLHIVAMSYIMIRIYQFRKALRSGDIEKLLKTPLFVHWLNKYSSNDKKGGE